MIRSLQNSAAGINAQQVRIDVTANNIVGVNVDSFKKQKASFADMVYSKMSDSGRPVAAKGEAPLSGSGSREVAIVRDFSQGFLRETGKETDMAINGPGFFRITMPDGSYAYTRSGNFGLSSDGRLITEDGYSLDPEITVPGGCKELMVDRNGKVSAVNSDGSTSDLGNINLYRFTNPGGLESLGKNLYTATDAAGTEEEGVPGRDGFGEIVQKSLESSNVDLAVEMTGLMEAQRIYQLNARALSTANEMWGIANNLRK